jgi:hypothetical protein
VNPNLNFSALDKKWKRSDFTSQQLSASGLDKTGGRRIIILVVAIALGILLVLPAFVAAIIGLATGRGATSWPAIVIILVILAAVIWSLRLSGERRLRHLKFALDNNLTYSANSLSPPPDPLMFKIGHSQRVNEQISWPNAAAALANFQYTIGYGRDSRTLHLDFMSVKLPRALPHLILNSRHNAFSPPTGDYKVQRIQLEGDFDKYFRLYAPPEYQIDALQIFTPDVMAALIKYGEYYDFELVGGELFVYFRSGSLNDAARLQTILNNVAQISAQFGQQVRSYSDARAGNVASGAVAPQGLKLKRRWASVGTIVAVVIAVIYLILTAVRQ